MTHPLPPAESLTVEFKSDRKRLPDHELVEAVVCLANAGGGELWLGVEDDRVARSAEAQRNAEWMKSDGIGWRASDW
jgi:ATP-dependent DNA helicase RecG